MLLQAMVLIATMVVLAGVLLTSTLASAHAAFHEMVLAKTQTATSDATARFATWAQDQVVRYGTEQSWPTASQPTNLDKTVGVTTPICDDAAAGSGTTTATCAMAATMRWNVTGWSANPGGAQRTPTTGSIATNLSTTLHEQRISATITVVLTNATSHAIYATHSRKVTARIFDAYPYVAVTALRDASSEDLMANSMEGDTGGALRYNVGSYSGFSQNGLPDRKHPANINSTEINTTIDCKNTIANSDEARPQFDSQTGTYIRIRNGGDQAWLYEAPCSPTYASQIDTTDAPVDYRASSTNVYLNDSTIPSATWLKSSQSQQYTH